jgi:hypothetical protein
VASCSPVCVPSLGLQAGPGPGKEILRYLERTSKLPCVLHVSWCSTLMCCLFAHYFCIFLFCCCFAAFHFPVFHRALSILSADRTSPLSIPT